MIRYFIPSDGDDPDHPNVFRITNNPNPIKLQHIKEGFPLPGEYHFRFKKKLGKTVVWVDVTKAQEAVPLCDGVVMVKVERLSASNAAGRSQQPPAKPARAPSTRLLNLEEPVSPQKPHQEPGQQEGNLLEFATATNSTKQALGAQGADTASVSSKPNDLFGSDPFASPNPGASTNFFDSDPFSSPNAPNWPAQTMQPMKMTPGRGPGGPMGQSMGQQVPLPMRQQAMNPMAGFGAPRQSMQPMNAAGGNDRGHMVSAMMPNPAMVNQAGRTPPQNMHFGQNLQWNNTK